LTLSLSNLNNNFSKFNLKLSQHVKKYHRVQGVMTKLYLLLVLPKASDTKIAAFLQM